MKKQIYGLLKVLPLFMAILVVTSCQKYKKEIERLNTSKDSIQSVVGERDSKIVEYVASFNEIQNNLDSIKQLQKIMNVNLSDPNAEVSQSQKNKIIEDINLINNLLNENKKKIAALQHQLKNSNLRIAELEQMIASYQRQIEEKDVEINALNEQIGQLQGNINELNNQVSSLANENQKKSATIKKQEDDMNTVWYCFGSKDELIENNIIEKAGGFIGLGKTYKLKSDFNHEYFKKIDARNFSEVTLMVKKAQLITTHPEGTFHFTGNEKSVETLVIDNPGEFWKASKYMVVLVEP